jgi:hypothetical protein
MNNAQAQSSVNPDITNVNRWFLIIAREQAKLNSGEIVTGLPRSTLNVLATMTNEEIESLASTGILLLSFRLTPSQVNRTLSLISQKAAIGLSYLTNAISVNHHPDTAAS